MITEKQYTELCEVSNEILNRPDSKIERVAIPWLHVIREHPIILAKYETLFNQNNFLGLLLRNIKESFTNLITK